MPDSMNYEYDYQLHKHFCNNTFFLLIGLIFIFTLALSIEHFVMTWILIWPMSLAIGLHVILFKKYYDSKIQEISRLV